MTHILSKEQFDLFTQSFHRNAHTQTLSSLDMILNNIFRDKDIRRGFTPITNPRKLSGGQDPWLGFKAPRNELRTSLTWQRGIDRISARIGIPLTPEIIAAIMEKCEEITI